MKWYLWIGLTFIIVGGGTVLYTKTRGLRNNNPGNIRKTGDKWQGLRPIQTDESFFQFSDAKYGIRAMAKLFKNYQIKYGLNTINDLINRWAPPTENNTLAYVNHVGEYLNVSVNEYIDLNNTEVLTKLVKVVIKHENGINPYSNATIAEGVALI